MWIFNNCELILTLIHWFRPPFFTVMIQTHTRSLGYEARETQAVRHKSTNVSPPNFYFHWISFQFLFHQPSPVRGWTSAFLLTGCVVSLRGDWAIFCHAGSGRVGRVRSAREKSLEVLRTFSYPCKMKFFKSKQTKYKTVNIQTFKGWGII